MSTSEPFMPNIPDDDAGRATGDAGVDQDRVEDDAAIPTPADDAAQARDDDATASTPDGSEDQDTAIRTPVPGESLSPEELAEED